MSQANRYICMAKIIFYAGIIIATLLSEINHFAFKDQVDISSNDLYSPQRPQ
jgi:hypothetical protein